MGWRHGFAVLLFLTFTSHTVSQQTPDFGTAVTDIADISEITDGGSMQLTCNADIANVPRSAFSIDLVKLMRNTTEEPNGEMIAQNNVGSIFENFREWRGENYQGSNYEAEFGGISSQNNYDTVYVTVVFKATTCTDERVYICEAQYMDGTGLRNTVRTHQNLVARAALEELTMAKSYHEGNDDFSTSIEANRNLTLDCNVRGPREATLTWDQRSQSSFGGFGSFSPIIPANLVRPHDPEPVRGTDCDQYQHRSTLSLTTTEIMDGTMYRCTARYGDTTHSTNFTISIRDENAPSASLTAGNGNEENSLTVDKDDDVTFTCTSEANPAPYMTLFRLNETQNYPLKILHGDSKSVTMRYTISGVSCVLTDVYVCVSRNSVGKTESRMSLFVNCPFSRDNSFDYAASSNVTGFRYGNAVLNLRLMGHPDPDTCILKKGFAGESNARRRKRQTRLGDFNNLPDTTVPYTYTAFRNGASPYVDVTITLQNLTKNDFGKHTVAIGNGNPEYFYFEFTLTEVTETATSNESDGNDSDTTIIAVVVIVCVVVVALAVIAAVFLLKRRRTQGKQPTDASGDINDDDGYERPEFLEERDGAPISFPMATIAETVQPTSANSCLDTDNAFDVHYDNARFIPSVGTLESRDDSTGLNKAHPERENTSAVKHENDVPTPSSIHIIPFSKNAVTSYGNCVVIKPNSS